MRTIVEAWQSFERTVISPVAPAIQRQEMRLAFYAGCSAMLGITIEIGSEDIREDAGMQILDGLHKEARAFMTELGEKG